FIFCFFFSSRRRHTRFSRDWSSDVCSSDLVTASLNNAGLMALMILAGGLLYEKLGGQIPLYELEMSSLFLLPLLILTMQLVNERSEERRVGKECRSRWWAVE